MNTKIRSLTTLLAATAATGAAIGLAPLAVADPGMATGTQTAAQSAAHAGTAPDPGYWNGGEPAGGTGTDAGPNTATGSSYWRGGNPAGGTGIDAGPGTASGPGFWSGGESAGAV